VKLPTTCTPCYVIDAYEQADKFVDMVRAAIGTLPDRPSPPPRPTGGRRMRVVTRKEYGKKIECDECGKEVDSVIEIDDCKRFTDLCLQCLTAAAAMLKEEKTEAA